MIVCGQVGAVIGAAVWLGARLPAVVVWPVLGALAVTHILAATRSLNSAGDDRHSDKLLFVQLIVDVAGLATLLYLAGGAANPFAWLMLLSITVAATILTKLQTWCVALEAIALYTVVMRFYVPLPGMQLPAGSGFALHVFGMWIGFILSALLIAYFVAGMTADMRVRDAALARAREQALRDERLASLGVLAASAAHELGTPLGTLTVLAEETGMDLKSGALDSARCKLEVMDTQLRRCKDAIRAMASAAGAEAAQNGQRVDLATFLEQTIDEWRLRRPDVSVRYRINKAAPQLRLVAEQSLTSALTNIFDNAADASPDDVEISADWDQEALAVRVDDRGRGFAPHLKARVGKMPFTGKPQGHGLGLYLSKCILDRLGGDLQIEPRQGGGTAVAVALPLAELRV